MTTTLIEKSAYEIEYWGNYILSELQRDQPDVIVMTATNAEYQTHIATLIENAKHHYDQLLTMAMPVDAAHTDTLNYIALLIPNIYFGTYCAIEALQPGQHPDTIKRNTTAFLTKYRTEQLPNTNLTKNPNFQLVREFVQS